MVEQRREPRWQAGIQGAVGYNAVVPGDDEAQDPLDEVAERVGKVVVDVGGEAGAGEVGVGAFRRIGG